MLILCEVGHVPPDVISFIIMLHQELRGQELNRFCRCWVLQVVRMYEPGAKVFTK